VGKKNPYTLFVGMSVQFHWKSVWKVLTKLKMEEVQIHEEIFNTFSHKGNANQNYTEIPSHSSQLGHHQGNKQEMLGRMRAKELLLRM
jgi:hypothetical protein